MIIYLMNFLRTFAACTISFMLRILVEYIKFVEEHMPVKFSPHLLLFYLIELKVFNVHLLNAFVVVHQDLNRIF